MPEVLVAAPPPTAAAITGVRRFTRFYTRHLGLLGEGVLDTPFSLTQARLVYELANRSAPTAAELGQDLGLDPGYLSRLLRGLEKDGLLVRRRDEEDARRQRISLTEAGVAAFAALDRGVTQDITAMLEGLAVSDRRLLLGAMATIERLLGPAVASTAPALVLRPPEPGDYGTVVQRHGQIYAAEYGWDSRFEALVAEIVAGFIRDFIPHRERCWIAEREGRFAGSVFVVRQDDAIARLRLLLVEAGARGCGLGRQLVAECLRFARQAGYRRIILRTHDILHAARRIYVEAGFRLVGEDAHHSFGQDLVGQSWELAL